MSTNDYNGWINKETWLINLWLTNEPSTEPDLRMLAQGVAGIQHRAECLKAYVDGFNPISPDVDGMYHDLLQTALDHVDWQAIIAHHEHDDD